MNTSKQWLVRHSVLLAISLGVFVAGNPASAAPLVLANQPLFLNSSAPPLNLLVLGRDHKLYYEAYNDHSDLNNDGTLDIGYKPELPDPTDKDPSDGTRVIDYYGYFDSYKCYTYTNNRFEPSGATGAKKTCDGTKWSGDWLNYVTTSRIDALRKVLYGGTRVVDDSTTTVLERSHIPQDAHSWVKEYKSQAENGYDIKKYTPLEPPTGDNRHLFANVTLMLDTSWKDNGPSSDPPRLRVATNQPYRMWNWGSVESPVAGACASDNDGRCEKSAGGNPETDDGSGKRLANTPGGGLTDYIVRVEVCKSEALKETNCQKYPSGNLKPIGLIQQYGRKSDGTDTMLFGLLTGSYQKSKSGGVMRKEVGTIDDEINVTTDGTFKATVGIIKSIDLLRSAGYKNYRGNDWYRSSNSTPLRGAGTAYTCSDAGCILIADRPFNEGEFGGMWGNPVAEMMYEGLRYFAGKSGPLSDYDYGTGASFDKDLGLPRVGTYTNPYGPNSKSCAKPFELVMSDVNVSYDSDQLPGVNANFGGGVTNDLPGTFSVSSIADSIWNDEIGGTKTYFIGQSGADYDGGPTVKNVSSFASIRGLAPEEPTKQGSYYAASVANYGLLNDISAKSGDQKVQTFAVALASPLPRIEIPIGTNKITIVPFGKSVGGGYGINAASGNFQPTNQIVDFYMLQQPTASGGSFQVNYEDVEAGNDHDMDAIVKYTWSVSGNDVTIETESMYAAGGIQQHMGYVISGTQGRDGIYLEVRDADTSEAADTKYFLDTPNWPSDPLVKWAGECRAPLCTKGLPLKSRRTFTVGSTPGAGILQDPLWYAAKWGGFKDGNKNNKPDAQDEWDSDKDGSPDNYFLVTNALTLGSQLSTAFNEILARTASASSATVNSGSVSSTSRIFQATFDSGDWTGHLLSYKVNSNGTLATTADWDAAGKLPATRKIFTMNSAGASIPFTWDEVSKDATLKGELANNDTLAKQVLEYVQGSDANEISNKGAFRNRAVKLGDIINSSPIFVGNPSFYYTDSFEAAKYSDFRKNNANRRDVIYVGANDGMLHAFDATAANDKVTPAVAAGELKELFAYIPRSVFKNLKDMTAVNYQHKYFVDGSPNMGDVYTNGAWRTVLIGGLNNGGQGIYALDVTDPTNFTKDKVLWEFTDKGVDDAAGRKGDPDLGFTFSQPAIVKLKNGKWGAVFGNGYNSSVDDGSKGSGVAKLFVVDIANGQAIAEISTKTGTATDPNGLATPAVVDIDGDSIADYVFAGDLLGNMWKFDIRDTDATKWAVSYKDGSNNPKPLYTAVDANSNRQPITSRPEIARGPNGVGMMVLFGTGKYLELTDKTVDTVNPRVQTFYGIVDPNTGADSDAFSGRPGVATLAQQSILAEVEVPLPNNKTTGVRVTSNNAAGTRGWFMDMLTPATAPATGTIYKAERIVSNPIFRDGRVIFTTLIPQNDPCSFGGDSWLMEMDALTGSRLNSSPIDVNRDGQINASDMVTVNINGTNVSVPVSGTRSDVGIVPEPGILSDRNSPVEYKYTAGSSGNIQSITESTAPKAQGRQSWRPVR